MMFKLISNLSFAFVLLQITHCYASLGTEATTGEIVLSQDQIDKFNSGDEYTRDLVMTQVNLFFQSQVNQTGVSNIPVSYRQPRQHVGSLLLYGSKLSSYLLNCCFHCESPADLGGTGGLDTFPSGIRPPADPKGPPLN